MKPGRVLLFIILTVGTSLRASTEISVDTGWGGKFRPGRWSPLFITARDTQSRNVVLEVYAPHDRTFAMRVRQGFAIGPEPVMFPLLVPLRDDVLDESVATLRDARSGRELAHEAVSDVYGTRAAFRQTTSVGLDQIFLGVSGAGASIRMLENQFAQQESVESAEQAKANNNATPTVPGQPPSPPKKLPPRPVAVGVLEQRRLPATPNGYDALDALVLNRPDFNALNTEQQQAIVDWVRSGGRLLMWPGDDPLPAMSPLVNVLPCRVGDVKQLNLPATSVKTAGLPARFAKLKVRQLAPAPNADVWKFFDDDVIGYSRRLGFGQIMVLSFDAGSLQFDQPAGARTFWRPILDGLLDPPSMPSTDQPNYAYYSYGQQENQRYVNAIMATMQQLGEIPGIGTFGFSYVAGVLIAMMVIVGPVDWLVPRRLGKQPWTWVTTSGWIALITLGAIYVGHIFKSGDLYYRSLRLVDEADGQVVVTRDVACIYSPRTTTYTIDTDPESWWQPLSTDLMSYSRGGIKNDLNYVQSYRGNTPQEMLINVWNLRFIEGEQFAAAGEPGVIDASIHLTNSGQLKGVITNRGTTVLNEVWVRTSSGTWAVDGNIAPGQPLTIGKTHSLSSAWDSVGLAYNYYNSPPQVSGPIKYSFAGDLSLDRSRSLERMLKDRPNVSVVYARTEVADAPNPMHEPGARQDHRQIIRALVTLEQGTP